MTPVQETHGHDRPRRALTGSRRAMASSLSRPREPRMQRSPTLATPSWWDVGFSRTCDRFSCLFRPMCCHEERHIYGLPQVQRHTNHHDSKALVELLCTHETDESNEASKPPLHTVSPV
ncbi:hypothetical protein AUP68_06914 [Ilyonectria robusta]